MGNFGTILRQRRLDADLTLREFSRLTSYDASNLSKIERGINPAPPTITLRNWAIHLGLTEGSEEYQSFLDAAQFSRNRIPDDSPAEFRNQLLPALLRTVRSKKLTKQEFDNLVRLLNR